MAGTILEVCAVDDSIAGGSVWTARLTILFLTRRGSRTKNYTGIQRTGHLGST